jgi:exosortase A-associated hydrolase 1
MPSPFEEQPFYFPCAGEQLLGIATLPTNPAPIGVLIIVGGPQYRVGSHRQFVHLARDLAERGIACMRFDYRGMGDSTGAMRTYVELDDDIRAAVDAFMARCPQLRGVVLWGLCGGASAACFYAATDARIASVALVNPWVRTEQGLARAHLKYYYSQRLLSGAFWRQLFTGRLAIGASMASFLKTLRAAIHPGDASHPASVPAQGPTLSERMAHGLAQYRGKTLVLLSGNDYTAKEFIAASAASATWQRALRGAKTATVNDSDHTFSNPEWKVRVATITAEWLQATP